mgnify:CR=1 FL=1
MKLNPRFLMEEFAKGKTPKQLIAEGRASKNTVYNYWRDYPCNDSKKWSYCSTQNVQKIQDVPIENSILIYPNPVSGNVEIGFHNRSQLSPFDSSLQINLFDSLGHKIHVIKTINASGIFISKENLAPGIYFYELFKGKDKITSGKIVVQ